MYARTTTALLQDLRDPANEAVWRGFDARYRPVLVALARRFGLGNEDAADTAQEALVQFVRSYRAGNYERGRGRLSSWIMGIARNCIIDQQRARAARREQRGISALAELPGDDCWAEIWDAECDREVLRQAVQVLHTETRIDAETIRAFELLAFHQLAPSQAAAELGMTLNEVYLAKHRCLKRLRRIVATLQAAGEGDR